MGKPYDPKVYIRHKTNEDGEHEYYIGQSGNCIQRTGGKEHGHKIAQFPASEDGAMRHMQESEMIQFCAAAGLPIANEKQLRRPFLGYELEEEWR